MLRLLLNVIIFIFWVFFEKGEGFPFPSKKSTHSSRSSRRSLAHHESENDIVAASPIQQHKSSDTAIDSQSRRAALLGFCTAAVLGRDPASAAGFFQKKLGLYVVDTRDAESVPTEQIGVPVPTLSSEYALLDVLPVKNPVFRTLETNIQAISTLKFGGTKFQSFALFPE